MDRQVIAHKPLKRARVVSIRATGHFRQLAREAQKLGGFKTPAEAANAALAEYIDRLRCRQYRA